MKIIITFLLFVTSLFSQDAGFLPEHAHFQIVTNACGVLKEFNLKGIVQKGDLGSLHGRWPTSCGNQCVILGAMPPDSLGNPWIPDESWGSSGIRYGTEYNEFRLKTVTGSKKTGPVYLTIPLSCEAGTPPWGLWAFFENNTFDLDESLDSLTKLE